MGKQAKFILSKPKRLNVLYGSWRSSKSVAVDIKWIKDCITLPEGNMLMVGNTINSLIRNVITPIKKIVGERNVDIRKQSKEVDIFDRTIWMEGADKEDAFKRIEGESLLRAYVDEWIHVPKTFTRTMLSRLSDPGACAYVTCNPSGPDHYCYTDYILRQSDLDIAVWKFTLDDNPWLDPAYKAAIIAENPPGTVFYDRNILGNWVAASGLVFSNFDRRKHVVPYPPRNLSGKELRVGVDYGTHNPTSFISITKYLVPGRAKPTWYVTNEYYWDSTIMLSQKTDSEYSKDLATYLSGKWTQPLQLVKPKEAIKDSDRLLLEEAVERGFPHAPQAQPVEHAVKPRETTTEATKSYPTTIEVDPSAASFILQAQRDGMIRARSASNDVLNGIRKIASMLYSGELFICESCPWLIYTMGLYSWNKESPSDEVIKKDDHPIDALRYVVNSL